MHVILFLVGHLVVSQNIKKHGGGMMKLTPPSKKKDDWVEGGDIEKYLQAKRKTKSAVYAARKRAQEDKFGDLKYNDQCNQIFKEARRMKNEYQDIVGEKCIKDDDGNLAFDDKSKLAAWKCQYEKLPNVEFPWDSSTLSKEQPF